MGVLLTLVLVIFTSVIGMSLVRNQGFKNFVLMQQKMAAGENPAAEMIKSVSLIIAGFAAFITGLFYRLPRSSTFIAAGAKASDSEVDAAFALFSYARAAVLAPGAVAVILLMVSTSERMMSATALIIKTIARINGRNAGLCGYAIFRRFSFWQKQP